MTCPKCGGELIINSNLCPKCDVAEISTQPETKKKRRLTPIGKLAIAIFVIVAAVICAVTLKVHYSRLEIHGISNGNRLNNSLVCETKTEYYFSTVNELYCSNKRFGSRELVDESADIIANVIYCNGCVYYTKENSIYCYNPSQRKKYAVAQLNGECSVAAKSYYDVYYSYDDALYMFSTRDASFSKVTDGIPVIDEGRLYLFADNALYEADFETLSKTKINAVSEYSRPVFVRDEKLFCYEYKEQRIFSVSLPDGALTSEFKSGDYQNISDVTHMNISDNYLFLRGENGIYRYDFETGEILCMTTLGYMEYINACNGMLYTVTPDSTAYFIDLNGNIVSEIAKD